MSGTFIVTIGAQCLSINLINTAEKETNNKLIENKQLHDAALYVWGLHTYALIKNSNVNVCHIN